MKELYENGPIVISFEPSYQFMHYKSGIYDSLKENWTHQGATKPEWEKVDHSVIAVGWGYDEKLKKNYWLIQNTWGEHWGEKGYFKMIRGIDRDNIESNCEVGNVVPINN
jgi:cathepsin C